MEIEILNRGAFGSALLRLGPGEAFHSEAGAFFHSMPNVDIDVTTRTRGKGGIWAGVKRLLGGESFFLSRYTTTDGGTGEIGLSPTLQGEVTSIDLDGKTAWVCAGGSYLGSGDGIELDTRFQGLRGMLSGESLFFLEAQGTGPLLVNAFGRIHELDVEGELIVDTGHVVAFEQSLDYSISKTGGSWLTSFLAGEGLIMHFRGSGRILVQSHNPTEFGRRLGPQLPSRKS